MAIILFTITSCQKDDVPQETIQEGPQFEVKKLTGSQLTSNRSLNKALLEAKANLSITSAQKSVYDSINGFWIDDSQVNHLTSGDYESYTFKITDPSDTTHLKNMVFSKQMDSTYQAFIVAYDLNYITLDDIRQGSIPVDATPYVRYTPVTSSFQHKKGVITIGEGECVSFAEVSPARNCTVGDHAPGEDCNLDEGDWRRAQEAILVFYMEPCGGGDLLPSNGDVNPGGDFPNDPGPPTGGQTNPGGSGQLPLINPNPNEQDEPCTNQLSLSDSSCAGIITVPTLPSFKEVLGDQLDDLTEGTDDEWEFDDSIDPNNSLYFDTVEEFETWKEGNPGSENSPPPSQRMDGRYDCLARYTDVLLHMEVDFIYSIDDPNTQINEAKVAENSVISGLGGVTFGLSYEEKRIDIDENSLNTMSVIEVKAALKYNVFFEGIGTIYTENIKITVMVDKGTAVIYNMYYD